MQALLSDCPHCNKTENPVHLPTSHKNAVLGSYSIECKRCHRIYEASEQMYLREKPEEEIKKMGLVNTGSWI